MKISVIVPAFNEEKLIAASLRSIQAAMTAFATRGWDTELIVCDNNSADQTADLARAAGVRVVFEPVNQIARARNTGAAAASGDWLLFVDADCRPSPELFADVAEQVEAGRCLAGGCTIRMETAKMIPRLVVGLWNWLSRTGKLLAGSFIFCEAAAFRQIGGFNEALFASEEIDLSRRLRPVAKQTGRAIVILRRHPLLTSGRKAELYTRSEYARFFVRTLWTNGETLKHREQCPLWYDGRR